MKTGDRVVRDKDDRYRKISGVVAEIIDYFDPPSDSHVINVRINTDAGDYVFPIDELRKEDEMTHQETLGGMIHGQGNKEQTPEGAVREANAGRGRFDLLPYEALEAYAIWSELGADKYGDRNWEKGLSVKDCINRMIRHAIKAGNGWTDEDHLAACMWNAAAAITMMQRRPDCNDHPWAVKSNVYYIKDEEGQDCDGVKKPEGFDAQYLGDWGKPSFSLGQEIYVLCPSGNTVGTIIAKNGELYNVKFPSGYVGAFMEEEMAAIIKDHKRSIGIPEPGEIEVKSALSKLDNEAIQGVLDMLIAEREFRKSTIKKENNQ